MTKQPYPIPEMVFARSWMLFRVSLVFASVAAPITLIHLTVQSAVIMQGIAARYARRQASSERAHTYVVGFPYMGHLAYKTLVEAGVAGTKSKL